MQPQTIGAIALYPAGKDQAGFNYYYFLSSREIINHRSWTTLPMPNHVIDIVHELAETDKN